MERAFSPDSALVDAVLPSPNHNSRQGFRGPQYVVLHYTGMATAESAIRLLRDPIAEVSSHYVICEDGRVLQLVEESQRAWHAGKSRWRAIEDMNSASIGIEICNAGHDGGLPPFAEPQIHSLIALCRDIAARQNIRPEGFLAHSDIAPMRKRDPGENFPWRTLSQAGVGLWADAAAPSASPLFAPMQEGPPVRALQTMLSLYGYGLEPNGVYDEKTRAVVAAFQRRFRQAKVDGLADESTLGVLRKLLTLVENSTEGRFV